MGDDPLTFIKKTISVLLLIFSLVVVHALIADKQTNLSDNIHPALAYVALWGALIWLSMVEGSQASMVGLPPIDRELYRESHPIAFKICERGHRGDNLDRYLMGRQFMVLALVFVINMSGAPIEDADVLNLPTPLANAFLKSGLAMILFTCMIGQLNTQVNASHCMLDYLNDHFATFTVWVAVGIEASGLLHASYLIQMIVAMCAGQTIESNEPPRDGLANVLYWGRVLFSCGCLGFAFAVTLAALFDGKTTMWDGIPEVVSIIFFFGLMSVVGMLEGMQIAFFAVAKMTEEERNYNSWATWTNELLFGNGGKGLPGFMIGRQLCVVSCFFVIARVTTVSIEDGDDNVLGVGDGAQKFFETGLLGALITTIVASIAWQLVASAFPLTMLGNVVTYTLLRICLFLEATGIASGAWVLASIHKKFAGFQKDEVYIGTAEERAAMGHGDKKVHGKEIGHLTGGGFVGNLLQDEDKAEAFTARRTKVLANISRLREQVKETESEEEKQIFEDCIALEVAHLTKINKQQKLSDKKVADEDEPEPIKDVEAGVEYA
uniref:Silicon transporter n=1 Tax=Entomoneis paludosa TaxID=265537 RepID=A0A7S2VFU4_9STRA